MREVRQIRIPRAAFVRFCLKRGGWRYRRMRPDHISEFSIGVYRGSDASMKDDLSVLLVSDEWPEHLKSEISEKAGGGAVDGVDTLDPVDKSQITNQKP